MTDDNNQSPRGIGDVKHLIVTQDEHERGEGLGIAMLLALVVSAAFGALLTYMWVVAPIRAEYERGLECLKPRPALHRDEAPR